MEGTNPASRSPNSQATARLEEAITEISRTADFGPGIRIVRALRIAFLVRWVLLCGLLASASGCLSFCHPVSQCWKDIGPPPVPRCCQSHVYIFFATGLDPLDCANLMGVVDYCHSLGYNATYYGQLWHFPRFEDEIHLIYHEDPDARIVLVGFSFGANSVRTVADH